MIPFYYAIVVILIGILFSYLECIKYLKGLRGITNEIPDHYPILVSILFGGPCLLLTYIFPEIRAEDSLHHRRYLVCGIIFTVLQIVLIYLLIYFKVFSLESTQSNS